MESKKYQEIYQYDGIIATRDYGGAIGAGLLSHVFKDLGVEFRDQIRSAHHKILLNPSFFGYLNVDSCLIIASERVTSQFFLWGNTVFNGSAHPTVASFISEIFDEHVPENILKSLKELEKGYKGQYRLSKLMFLTFLSHLSFDSLKLKEIFELVKGKKWPKIESYFEEGASELLKSDRKEAKRGLQRDKLSVEEEIVYYPLENELTKRKANLTAVNLQKDCKTVFILGEKGGVIPEGKIISKEEVDHTPLSNLIEEERLERLGAQNILTFSFSPAQHKNKVRSLLSQCVE